MKTAIVKVDNAALQSVEKLNERFGSITSVIEARNTECHTLKAIARNNSTEKAMVIIAQFIQFGMDHLNIKGKMKPFQIRNAAQIIFQEYGHYKISELQFVITRGMRGQYGRLFDKVDISDIKDWFKQYDREKMDSCYMQKSQASTKRIIEANYDDPKYVCRPTSIKKIVDRAKKKK